MEYDIETLQSTFTLHDDREGRARSAMNLRIYRLPTTLHDDREGQARWAMKLRLYRLPTTLHDDREKHVGI